MTDTTKNAQTPAPRLVTTNHPQLGGIYEVVDDTSDTYLIVTPYPQQEKERATYALSKGMAIPYVETMTWFPCNVTVKERDGHNVIAHYKDTVAILAPGYRVRVDDKGLWHWEKGESHVSK